MRDKLLHGLQASTLLGILVIAFVVSEAFSGDEGAAPHGRLDGLRFIGTFAPEGENAGRKDTLLFSDGHFWSAICVPCGFTPGVYWVRDVGDAIHFRGQMESPERGTFTFIGVVRDGQVSAKIHWRKERWYWSLERDFRFEGKATGARVTERAARVARVAAAEGRVPKPKSSCPL